MIEAKTPMAADVHVLDNYWITMFSFGLTNHLTSKNEGLGLEPCQMDPESQRESKNIALPDSYTTATHKIAQC